MPYYRYIRRDISIRERVYCLFLSASFGLFFLPVFAAVQSIQLTKERNSGKTGGTNSTAV